MASYELDFHMPASYRKLLLDTIALTEANNCLSFYAFHTADGASAKLHPGAGMKETVRFDGRASISPFHAFCVLELLIMQGTNSNYGSSTIYHITPLGYRWYEYQRKSPTRRFFARRSTRDIALVFSLVVAVISLVVSGLTAWKLATELHLIP